MSFNHSVSDLATIIRNGSLARKAVVHSPVSKLRENILKILKEEGYILSYSKSSDDKSIPKLDIHLKYHNSLPAVKEIKVVSTPGRRVYCDANSIPVVKNGLGTVLLSTSKGVLSDHVAKSEVIGGEVLLKIF